MAWLLNDRSIVTWSDGKGPVGGFARDPQDEDGTGVGPVYSPNGQAWFIIVDDAGNVKTAQVT